MTRTHPAFTNELNLVRGFDSAKRPKRLILVRHAQSMGNISETLYASVADNMIPLTEEGHQQAREAGDRLYDLIGPDETVKFLVSPYKRTMQTCEHLIYNFSPDKASHRTEARLREQDFGNYQDTESIRRQKKLRREYGSFYFRYSDGESGADVYDRVSTVIESIHREWQRQPEHIDNYVLVSHGLTCRLFLMRYYHWTVDEFHQTYNIGNGQLVIMEKDANGRYDLVTKLRSAPVEDEDWAWNTGLGETEDERRRSSGRDRHYQQNQTGSRAKPAEEKEGEHTSRSQSGAKSSNKKSSERNSTTERKRTRTTERPKIALF